MINLIASDMDGTLLNEKKELPKDFFSILDLLEKKDITFVAASGRPYSTLVQNFAPVNDSISYIGDNGALVVHKGKVLYKNIIDMETIQKLLDECKTIDNIVPILCGEKRAYHPICDNIYLKEINKYYLKTKTFKDLKEVHDDIFKIAICDLNNPKDNSYAKLNPIFSDKLSIVISGDVWVDIMNPNVNKGNGLKIIQKEIGATKNTTMAFGDYYNDIEMLRNADFSFVMENALDDMKQHGKYIAKSNNDNGVIEAIKKLIL